MIKFQKSPLRVTLLLFGYGLVLLQSCISNSTRNLPSNYPDEVYHQFWTADWSPDGKWIAVGGVDSLLRIYHAPNLKLFQTIPMDSWIHVVKWQPKGNLLAIATLDKYVQLLDMEKDSIMRLSSMGGSRAIGWNHSGDRLAVGDLGGDIQIWNNQGAMISHVDMDYSLEQAGPSFLGLDWHPEENVFVAVNYQINMMESSGTTLSTMEHPNKEAIMLCVDWHPSGDFFVIGDYGHNWEGENVPSLLHFWTKEGTLIKSVPGSKGEYRNIAWSKDGTNLATASDVLRIWDQKGNLSYQSEEDGLNYLWGISWSPNYQKIVTSSRYKSISIWNNKAKLHRRLEVFPK